MRIVAVSGACSRAGKTSAAVSLLQSLPGASALKFTVTEDVFKSCPRGAPCLVCDIDVPFRIVEDPRVIREAGTDTARFAEAGAARVLWAITRRGAAADAWAAVQSRLGGTVVLEGSTVVELAHPARLVFVVHPFLSPSRWKDTSPALVARADVVIVNRPAAERREPSPEVLRALREMCGGRPITVADATSPVLQWAPGLLEALETAA